MDYRTENENEVFKIFRRFTAVCEGEKEKATTDFARLSPSVGMRRLERPTPLLYQLSYGTFFVCGCKDKEFFLYRKAF